jgi:hypothetical protein
MSSGPASRLTGMETERVTASTTIEAAPEAVFAVLADPSAHADIDGTGWVRESLEGNRITAAGQVFRMAMYHPNHPDKDYEIANLVEVFDEPRAIAWKPGTESPQTRELSFGGWIWRYDLEATGPSRTTVTLRCWRSRRLTVGRQVLQARWGAVARSAPGRAFCSRLAHFVRGG